MSSDLLYKAIDAVKSGDKKKGQDILLKLIDAEPDNEYAWMWLCACVEDNSKKIDCLEKVIEINPANERAKSALTKLRSVVTEPDIQDIISKSNNEGVNKLSSVIESRVSSSKSIEFIPANCPNCGGELRVPSDKTVVKCMYCGHDIIIHDPNNVNVNLHLKIDISKPLKLARVSEEGKNYEDGYKYYSQVLEQDSDNIESWLGRARCAAWRCTAVNQTLEEAISYVKTAQALQSIPMNELAKTVNEIARATVAYTDLVIQYLAGEYDRRSPRTETGEALEVIIKNAARNSLEKEINTKFIKSYFPVIYRVFNFCWNLTPSKEVGAALYMLFGVVQNNKHYGTINQETRQYVVNCFGKITIVLQQKFPDLQPPKQEKSCFIATATMGNIDHPYVETLRQYRDLVLRKSRFGQTFIYLYYRNSPPVAKIIAKHTLLRKFSFRFLVNPLYKLASRTLKTRN